MSTAERLFSSFYIRFLRKIVEKIMKKTPQTFADEIRMEGITYMGYGVMPKSVALDPSLSVEAKAIYAYFASYSGGGSGGFPRRDQILKDLKISKDRYYRHFNTLKARGLISVVEKRNGQFIKNIYTLHSKWRQQPDGPTMGINDDGYGIIPKAVVKDPRIAIEAKGMYAYFCSFAGIKKSCVPARKDALFHLNLSSERYSKYRDILETLGYIVVSQVHKDGRLSRVQISLTDNPDMDDVQPRKLTVLSIQPSENKDTEELQSPENKDTKNQQKQSPENKDTEEKNPLKNQQLAHVNNDVEKEVPSLQSSEIQPPEKQDTKKQDTENKDTYIINNRDNNNLVKNKKIKESMEKYDNNARAHEDAVFRSLSYQQEQPAEAFTFTSPLGNLTLAAADKRLLDETFDDVDGLLELAVCALAQRKAMPKSMLHFVWEFAKSKHWKLRDPKKGGSNKQEQSADEALIEKWQENDNKEFEQKIQAFMLEEGISDYEEAADLYTARKRAEVMKKLGSLKF